MTLIPCPRMYWMEKKKSLCLFVFEKIVMEIITCHIKLLIPYVEVNENYKKLKTSLISLQTENCDS
jgi:hypothetical protein